MTIIYCTQRERNRGNKHSQFTHSRPPCTPICVVLVMYNIYISHITEIATLMWTSDPASSVHQSSASRYPDIIPVLERRSGCCFMVGDPISIACHAYGRMPAIATQYLSHTSKMQSKSRRWYHEADFRRPCQQPSGIENVQVLRAYCRSCSSVTGAIDMAHVGETSFCNRVLLEAY